MGIGARIRSFDRFQQEHKALAVPIAVLKKFADDGAGNKAALIAYFGFFSLFPLLLLSVTILGFVLQGDPSAQQAVLNSALKQFPIVSGQLGSQAHPLKGSGVGLAVGIVGALLSGLGVTMTAQNAFNTVYAVPHKARPHFLSARLRGLKLLAVFGLLQVVSTVVSGTVAGGLGGPVLAVAGIVVSLVLNLALFFAVFRLLTDDSVPTRELWPGVLIASVSWEVLQAVGGAYIGHVEKGAGATYGAFAVVIGLLVWLYLGARVVVYSAEINTVLTRGLWPRSIIDPPVPADRKARAALAKVEERDDKQSVDVTFHPDEKQPAQSADPDYAVAPEPAPGEHARPAAWPEQDNARSPEDQAARFPEDQAARSPEDQAVSHSELQAPPGTEARRRRRSRFCYELLSCGLSGHELVGVDAAELRPQDAIFARPDGTTGLRWHRCLRCDSWLSLPAPEHSARRYPPARMEIELPLRGRPLRDKYVLRLIAIDRAFHFVILGVLAVAIFAFLGHRSQLRNEFYRVLTEIQGGLGGPTSASHSTILDDLRKVFALKQSSLFALGLIAAGYALLEGVEAVGLWLRKRWAEYLTFIATTILLVPEVYELAGRISALKILALIINLLIAVYLLFAKRLFGLHGGGAAERAELERDTGWEALERMLPPHHLADAIPHGGG